MSAYHMCRSLKLTMFLWYKCITILRVSGTEMNLHAEPRTCDFDWLSLFVILGLTCRKAMSLYRSVSHCCWFAHLNILLHTVTLIHFIHVNVTNAFLWKFSYRTSICPYDSDSILLQYQNLFCLYWTILTVLNFHCETFKSSSIWEHYSTGMFIYYIYPTCTYMYIPPCIFNVT